MMADVDGGTVAWGLDSKDGVDMRDSDLPFLSLPPGGAVK